MSRSKAALVVGTAGMLLVGLLLVGPWLVKDRLRTASTPQPAPLYDTALITLPGGARACMSGSVMDELSALGHFRVGTMAKPGVPLEFTIRGSGGDYRVAERVDGDAYGDNDLVVVPVTPPPEPTEVTICIRNDGRRDVVLYASNEGGRTMTRAVTTVDGKEAFANFLMYFKEEKPASVRARASTIARRASVFRPGGPWIAWAAAVLMLGVAPAALVASLYVATRRDDDDEAGG